MPCSCTDGFGRTWRPTIPRHPLRTWATIAAFVVSAGCSRTPEPTAVLSARANETSLAGFCGRLDDGLVHVPPHYNDFTPPQKGASYADPQYGCPILRLTDGKSQFHEAVHHQYSTISAINQDDSLAMLVTGSGQALITDLKGNVVIAPGDFPETNSS